MKIDKVITYCWQCHRDNIHNISWDNENELSSTCSECENRVMTQSPIDKIIRHDELFCPKCGLDTTQIQFLSDLNYIHWFCCSCGRDFAKEIKFIHN